MKQQQPREWVVAEILQPLLPVMQEAELLWKVCGSYRRGKEKLGDLDIIVDLPHAWSVEPLLERALGRLEILRSGDMLFSCMGKGFQLDWRAIPQESWGAGMLAATGPSGFNIGLRSVAKRRGMLLNEYGLYVRNPRKFLAGKTEREIFAMLGMPPVSPVDRKPPKWLENRVSA
jgi:DNA polymerase (family 10)